MASETRASYTDTFAHAFDDKGRITVPADWRQESYESRLFVVPSSEACVRVYPESWMSALQDKVSVLKDGDPMRRKVQEMASMAQGATWDQQGRMMVKEKLRQRAGLSLKKEAVMVGLLTHFEIWDKAAWEKKQVAEPTIEEALSAIGL
jgi:MraZ protein